MPISNLPYLLRGFVLFTLFISYSNLALSQNSFSISDPACNPTPKPDMPQYIIGYGSLMQSQSKNRTDPHAGKNLPVIVYGYQRGWFVEGLSRHTSPSIKVIFLGTVHDKESQFNGVIFKVAKDAFKQYDQREKYYCREEVSPYQIRILTHQPVPKGQFWIYVAPLKYKARPSAVYPISQSYVDIFLSGCLALQQEYQIKNFATACITTTHYWSSWWFNDRPYLKKSFEQPENKAQIDKLLSQKTLLT